MKMKHNRGFSILNPYDGPILKDEQYEVYKGKLRLDQSIARLNPQKNKCEILKVKYNGYDLFLKVKGVSFLFTADDTLYRLSFEEPVISMYTKVDSTQIITVSEYVNNIFKKAKPWGVRRVKDSTVLKREVILDVKEAITCDNLIVNTDLTVTENSESIEFVTEYQGRSSIIAL